LDLGFSWLGGFGGGGGFSWLSTWFSWLGWLGGFGGGGGFGWLDIWFTWLSGGFAWLLRRCWLSRLCLLFLGLSA
jgi:hypothetical protein